MFLYKSINDVFEIHNKIHKNIRISNSILEVGKSLALIKEYILKLLFFVKVNMTDSVLNKYSV